MPKFRATPGLRPSLSLWDALAINIGAIIGSGIFVVTGISAGYAGSAIVVSIIIAATVSSLTALSLIELTIWDPREGGVYDYAGKLISPLAGYISGWMWSLSNTLIGAAVALSFAFYLAVIFPGLSVPIVAAVICIIFTVLNYYGASHTAELNNAIVLAKLAILSFFIIFGLMFVDLTNLQPFEPLSEGMFVGAFYIFFAFGGFARVTVIAAEVKEPKKNVPKAIIWSLAISVVFYILIALVAVGLVGGPGLSSSSSPLALAMSSTGSAFAVLLISIGGVLATASVLITTILGVSRMEYAMAQQGDLPKAIARVHPRYDTPSYAIVLTGGVIVILVLFVDVVSVVTIGTFAQLFYYMFANISAFRLRTTYRKYPKFVPVLGFLSCLLLLLMALFISPEAIFLGVGVVILGLASWMVRIRFFGRPQDK
jgi:basic amino acid/polyamine antiporter, APA family